MKILVATTLAFVTAAAMVPVLASAPTDAVTPIADLQRGTMATIQGTVTQVTDKDEFRLADASGTIRVYVGRNRVPADAGEAVIVNGFVDDEPGLLEFYASRLTRADGTVVVFDHEYR